MITAKIYNTMSKTEISNRFKSDRVAKLGETAVILKLTEMGWDAFNLNATNPNYQGVDVLAVNPNTLESKFIQVKSSALDEPNFPTGLISNTKGEIIVKKNKEWVKDDNWKEKFVGPWVFVHIKQNGEEVKYDFYILTKEEVTKLIEDSNKWYWEHVGKAKGEAQLVGLPLCWITGEGLVNGAHSFRGYPRNVDIDEDNLHGNVGWAKIGVVE